MPTTMRWRAATPESGCDRRAGARRAQRGGVTGAAYKLYIFP
ncbi:hypothetical protein X976_5098 [Burkholderia pseudomallei MSHR7500]|nr:hypothetical protein DO70_1722 [Burkholderia pseudomallei]KGS42119.1 hypothetical protein X945_924 [Burkholderia pseudomallei ABCPW 107]KGS77477.1 hypothetical protein X976_5098 [Burkholderia pseudomallei MSHR7500]